MKNEKKSPEWLYMCAFAHASALVPLPASSVCVNVYLRKVSWE